MRNTRWVWVLFVLAVIFTAAASPAQVVAVVSFGPPALPIYEQPPCPAEGYIWTPGYWAYDSGYEDYYWVPGTWVLAPEVGFLWTPGYWAWNGGGFVFYDGYWGPQVGFYGGIVYGFGYFGEGYEGGRWDGDRFFYNRSVNNVNTAVIHNVYNTTVINNTTVNRVSYNGGKGGVNARPTRQDEAAAHARHLPAVPAQVQHVQTASTIPELRASANQGRPPIAATPKPAALHGPGVVSAREAGAPYHPPANRAGSLPTTNAPAPRPGNAIPQPSAPIHAKDLPHPQPAPANTANAEADRQYQQEQQRMNAQQEQERQKLQQQQEQDHQRLAQRKANQAQEQQLEMKHQQQTQQLQQQHAQQQQELQQRQQATNRNQAKPPKQP